MAKILPTIFRINCCRILQISESRCAWRLCYPIRNNIIRTYSLIHRKEQLFCIESCRPFLWSVRNYTQEKKPDNGVRESDNPKPTLFQRFKTMYKDYWYVLIPVHVVTSVGWFGGFYYMARSGVDIVGLLEAMNFSEKIVDSMRDSKMGYFAIAYGCYKVATPARYTVTLGGTTISINYLKKWGYIKPVPSAEKLKEMYKERKGSFDRSMREKKEDLIAKKDEFKCKLDGSLEQGIHKIEELKDRTEQMKKKAKDILKEKK